MEGTRWDKALFMTYALSLTYFETYVLPKLREAGCEEIWVLADVEGYRGSLMELRARHVGQEYSLIPVAVCSGIFHPKITYLWGAAEDILMVGSGNLTFGGHGQNVEVLEVMGSEANAQVFEDFAAFLEALRAKDAISVASDIVLRRFLARAQQKAKSGQEKGNSRLLHSLIQPISEQIRELAAGRTWDSLLVLSPFHSPDGEPIKAIVHALGIERLTVGVPGSPDVGFSFPFPAAQSWHVEVEVVTPNVEKMGRRLHAKWLELRGDESWAITGSVNATAQSMGSTRNVEVAVLRRLDEPTTALWKKAKRPVYRTDQIAFSDASTLTAYGELDGQGVLSGRILGDAELAGEWHVYLECSDEIIATTDLNVGDRGEFSWRLEAAFEMDGGSAPQIRLIKGDLVARGWVSIKSFLAMPSRSRTAMGALSRMLSRSESQEDIRVLLDYIAFHAEQFAIASSQTSRIATDEPKREPDDKAVSVDALYQLGASESGLFRELASSAATTDASWEVLHAITMLLLGRNAHTSTRASAVTHTPSRRQVIEDNEDQQREQATLELLEQFSLDLQKILKSEGLDPTRRAQLLFVWGNVSLDMYLRRLQSRMTALDFAKAWLLAAVRVNPPLEQRKLLDDTVFGIAAALALNATESRQGANFIFGITMTKQLVHEWLEAYCHGDVELQDACGRAESWFSHETPRLLVDGMVEQAVSALATALRTQTNRQVLTELVAARESAGDYSIPADFFSPEELALLRQLKPTKAGRPGYYQVNHHFVRACPNTRSCGVTLIKDTLTKLRLRRIGQCVNCKAVMISLAP